MLHDKFDLQMLGEHSRLLISQVGMSHFAVSPLYPSILQHNRLGPTQANSLSPLWVLRWDRVRVFDLQPVSSSFLDGTNTTEYVRSTSRCVRSRVFSLKSGVQTGLLHSQCRSLSLVRSGATDTAAIAHACAYRDSTLDIHDCRLPRGASAVLGPLHPASHDLRIHNLLQCCQSRSSIWNRLCR